MNIVFLHYQVSILDDNSKEVYSYSTKSEKHNIPASLTCKVPSDGKTYKVNLKVEKYATKDRKKLLATKDMSIDVEAKETEFYRLTDLYSSVYMGYNDCLYVSIFDRYNYQKMEIQIIDKSNKAVVKKHSYEGKPLSVFTDYRYKTSKFCGLKKGKYDIKVIASKPYQMPAGSKTSMEKIIDEISLK